MQVTTLLQLKHLCLDMKMPTTLSVMSDITSSLVERVSERTGMLHVPLDGMPFNVEGGARVLAHHRCHMHPACPRVSTRTNMYP